MSEMNAKIVLTLQDKVSAAARKIVGAVKTIQKGFAGIQRTNAKSNLSKQFTDAEAKSRRLRQELTKLKSSLQGVHGSAKQLFGRGGLLAMAVGGGKVAAASSILPGLRTAADFEKYTAMLKGTLKAGESLAEHQDNIFRYEAASPFNLEEVTRGYVRLKRLGIDPMAGAMRAAGDAAATNGTDFMQAIEAIADAKTKEFDRLKEFGITTESSKGKAIFTYTDRFGEQKQMTANLNDQLGLVTAITKIWGESFGGATDELAKGWGGLSSSVESFRQKFELLVMNGGPFERLKGLLSDLLKNLQTWEQDGTLKRWADKFSRNFIEVMDKAAPAAKGLIKAAGDLFGLLDKAATAAGGYDKLFYVAGALWMMGPALRTISAAKDAAVTLTAIAGLATGGKVLGLLAFAGGLGAVAAAALALREIDQPMLDKLENWRPLGDDGKKRAPIYYPPSATIRPLFALSVVIQEWAVKLGSQIKKSLIEGLGSLYDVGANWIVSLWDGMKSKIIELIKWARSMGVTLKDALTGSPGNIGPGPEPGAMPVEPFGLQLQNYTPNGSSGVPMQKAGLTIIQNNTYNGSDRRGSEQIAANVVRRLRGSLSDGAYA
jgi:hypothetical protein